MVPATGVGALINYTRPVDKYTRLLCYMSLSRAEYLPDNEFNSLCTNRSSIPNTPATHIIVLVNWGINCAVILQLPPDEELVNAFDYAIEKLCISLRNNHGSSILSEEDTSFLEKIIHTEVFSNIPDLCKINSIIDFYRDTVRVKNDSSLLKPHNYHLCPIQEFYAVNNDKQSIFYELQVQQVERIEHYVLQLFFELKRLTTTMDQGFPNLQQHLKKHLYEMRAQWSKLKEKYTGEIQGLRELVINIRKGKDDQNKIDQELSIDETRNLRKAIDEFTVQINTMKRKDELIKDLLEKQFQYKNALDHDIKLGDKEEIIERKFLIDVKRERIVCFDDNLYDRNKSQWHTLHGRLIKERDDNPQLRIICVDFSYCSYKLKYMIILPSIEKNNVDESKRITSSSSERSKSDDINILLLGESGAGKSTFINAFVNYLFFNTLKQAQNKPIVLIPVSFLMTFGDDFQERTVTFGGLDTLSNEDHDHSSQSVTQHCKSYVFTLRDGDDRGRKLRIIDTPGIGDVRGSAQDDINMQYILSYINNLSHLNAVCILMKPNNPRLNVFFRSCLIQLFDLLGESTRDKIIFCFTNARATFYAPGNTGPLLKNFLETLPIKNIPFTKRNTFCFDSESFRYLVAVQNEIPFSKSQEEEYEDSWNKSSAESKRFLEYIRTNMTESLVLGERESMKDAQLRISLVIRPMLETMRNILRNIILWSTGSRTESIQLSPRIIKCTTAICFTCPRQYLQIGDFWITADALHVFHNKCRTCGCSPDNHYPIDYQLEYKLQPYPASNSNQEMTKMADDLCQTSAEFGHFLLESTNISENDSFLTGFERMIKEEDDICTSKAACLLNADLVKCLKQVQKNYEKARQKLSAKKEHIQLSTVFAKIRDIDNYSMIKSQMTAVKEWHKFMIKYYEYEVPV